MLSLRVLVPSQLLTGLTNTGLTIQPPSNQPNLEESERDKVMTTNHSNAPRSIIYKGARYERLAVAGRITQFDTSGEKELLQDALQNCEHWLNELHNFVNKISTALEKDTGVRDRLDMFNYYKLLRVEEKLKDLAVLVNKRR